MVRKTFAGVLCGFAFAAQIHAQIVEIPRQASAKKIADPQTAVVPPIKVPTRPEQTIAAQPAESSAHERESAAAKLTVKQMREGGARAAQKVKKETYIESSSAARVPSSQTSRPETVAYRSLDRPVREPEPIAAPPTNYSAQTAFIKLADGFDFPVGKPDAQGYYKARGFHSHDHLGEDWDGVGGGNTDLGDPIYCIGDGIVVFARDCHMGWGNVVIVRHAYREGRLTRNIDSLYAHLEKMLVHCGQSVRRGQQIATMGTAHGLYEAHLHFEIRKNIEIGMSRAKFAQDFSNYYEPSQFILSRRHLQGGGASYRVAMNTFTQDAKIRWDKARNYSHSHYQGGSSESANALKKALAAQGTSGR